MWVFLFLIQSIGPICVFIMVAGNSVPHGAAENVILERFNSVSTKISWRSTLVATEKYEMMYKPTEASFKVVAVLAANSNSVTLKNLTPNTQYQLSITAIKSGKKYRSRSVVFRTLDLGDKPISMGLNDTAADTADTADTVSFATPEIVSGLGSSVVPPFPAASQSIQVRGVEVAIVVIVLLVWIGAILLFFNRWGKIRMLIPYQPDYKETQHKVPGTGICAVNTTSSNQVSSRYCCSQRYLRCDKCAMNKSSQQWRNSSPASLQRFTSCFSSNVRPFDTSSGKKAYYCYKHILQQEQSESQLLRKCKSADNVQHKQERIIEPDSKTTMVEEYLEALHLHL